MKRLLILFVLLFTVFFSYTVIAQEFGSLKKGFAFSFPEKIQKLVLDPLPAGTYSIGTGGDFPTIDSAFNKLETDGVAGNVTLELIDNLYTAPAGQYGYVLNGSIPGAGPNSRVTIKPAANKNVTIQGNNEGLLFLINTSYVTFDGVGVTGATTLTINALQNASYAYNDALDFNNNSNHNIIQNITFVVDDYLRPSAGIWFSGSAPDSNLIQYNAVKKAGIFLSITTGGNGNIIRGNQIGSETDSLVAYGIEVVNCEGTLIENNLIQNMKVTVSGSNQAQVGIALDGGNNQIIRNNVIRNCRAISGYITAGIYVGVGGTNNQIYNNMVYGIHSTSIQSNSRLAGIYLAYQTNPKIYYNSVYLLGSGATPLGSAALYIYTSSTNVDAKNNIFVNTRDESPYYASVIYDYSASNLTSDYNDLYSNNYLVRIGSTNYNTLADWQATGKDLNSITEMPNFVDPYLHIDETIGTYLESGATPIAGIDSDFDGELRNVSTPDIGADEFDGFTLEDPLPAGTYTIGTGGNFATIQDAFNKLETDGVAGNVTLELIDDLYTAPADTFGFLLDGPIPGAGPNSRVTIKPAENKNVTVEGNWRYVFTFRNVSYLTFDGISTEGSTTLTIHSLYNSQYETNRGIVFWDNADHNIAKNLTIICDDIMRDGIGIFFVAGPNSLFAPDSNLIQNNFIKKAGAAIVVGGYFSASNTRPTGNIVVGNKVGSDTDSLIAWGIQLEKSQNSIVEDNIVQNLKLNNGYAWENMNIGINSYWGNGDIIRNNVVHNIEASGGYTSVGILLSGDVGNTGSNNLVYNNMVHDIQSTSTQSASRVTGIQMWRQNNPEIYYNSVYLSGTGTNHQGSAALYVWGDCANVDAKNNILVNTRDESPYYATAIYDYSASNLTSDYNDLYANNYLVRIGNTNYNTLADWQAMGKDLNSVTEMPHFVDPYLHINPSALTQINGGAFPIAEVTSDFDGDLRNQLNPDIGADEFLLLLDTLYVPQEYSTIQAAIDAAVDENLVLVDEGTYIENINFKGKAITVASNFFIDGDETHIENTIIDGSQPSHPDSGSVITFNSGEDTTSIIFGFTITGGTGTILNIPSIGLRRIGGGILAYNSGAAITNNIIELNSINYSSDSWGGGIGAFTHTARNYIIDNNIIRDNSITTPTIIDYSLGGGIYTQTAGYVRIANNKILENSITAPQGWGGGILPANFGGGSYFILNNFISGNGIIATTGGSGGIDIYNHSPVVKNNLIYLNSAPKGGGVSIENASPIFNNNTIAYNTAITSGGGIDVVSPIPEITNCIIWGNSAATGSQINGTANVSYSDVEGGYTGIGNIQLNPEFTDTTYFLLSNTSPCVDAGNPGPIYNDIEDPNNSGFALWPAQGGLRNDMGHCGGPNSFWYSIVTSVEDDDEDNIQPTDFSLFQNYPNPFNPSTTFRYSIPTQSKVVIKVYDILGNEIATLMDEEKSAGTYELTWHATNLPSGVYFYQLSAGEFIQTKKMLLLK